MWHCFCIPQDSRENQQNIVRALSLLHGPIVGEAEPIKYRRAGFVMSTILFKLEGWVVKHVSGIVRGPVVLRNEDMAHVLEESRKLVS